MQRITGTVVKTGTLALALALGLALSGCGGGGGGGDKPPVGDSPPVAQRAVAGTAAKGLIKGARVNVHALDAQGVRATASLANALTGADGSYKLQVPLSVRNFVIEVSSAVSGFRATRPRRSITAIRTGARACRWHATRARRCRPSRSRAASAG